MEARPAGAAPEIIGLARAAGITRLADITGLDIVGLPVIQTVRPASLSNAVSQGKGTTLAAAAASAVFESVEAYAAERIERFAPVHSSAEKLAIDTSELAPYLLDDAPHDWASRPLPWIEANDILGERVGFVPLEMIHTAYTWPVQNGDGIFASSTTGLGAGFSKPQAAMHAMLEVIERDAIARAYDVHGFFQRFRIDETSICYPEAACRIAELRQRGFLIGLWHAPSPTGVPVIWCHVMEECDPERALVPVPCDGTAARADPGEAICQAIYEAAQSRVTAISGARDDFTRAQMPRYRDHAAFASHRTLLADGPRDIASSSIPSFEKPTIDHLLSAFQHASCSAVFQVDLDASPLAGISVIKIFAPAMRPLVTG